MIVVKRKPLQEILKMIGQAESVLIVGCDGCAAIYQEGGQKQVDLMKLVLTMAKKLKQNKNINVKTTSILRQCDRQICATSLRPLVNKDDVILSMGCGAGTQTLAQVFENNTVIPAHDTMFIGAQDREQGKLYELCSACGQCILYETGGICPITRCAKQLLNGPCGGQAKGKCEVGGWKNDCAWILIYNRLKEKGHLDLFTKYREQRDFRISQSPREIDETEEKTEETP